MCLKKLEKEHKNKIYVFIFRKREVLKIKAKIVQVENWQFVGKLNESQTWLFEKNNKIDYIFLRVIEKSGQQKMYIIRNKNGDKSTDRE